MKQRQVPTSQASLPHQGSPSWDWIRIRRQIRNHSWSTADQQLINISNAKQLISRPRPYFSSKIYGFFHRKLLVERWKVNNFAEKSSPPVAQEENLKINKHSLNRDQDAKYNYQRQEKGGWGKTPPVWKDLKLIWLQPSALQENSRLQKSANQSFNYGQAKERP